MATNRLDGHTHTLKQNRPTEIINQFFDSLKAERLMEAKAGFDPNQPRDDDGQWSRSGGWHKIDIDSVVKSHLENTGSTIDPLTGKDMAFTPGAFSVSINKDRTWNPATIGENLTKKSMAAYLEKNKDLFMTGKKVFGSWYGHDEKVPNDPDQLWLDVATIVYNKKEAIDLAIENDQISIFDLENMVEIKTGGSGKYNVFIMGTKGPKTAEEIKRAWAAWGRYMANTNKKVDPEETEETEKD